MNFKAYRIAKLCESIILFVVSGFLCGFSLTLLINPNKAWGIAGIFIVFGLLILFVFSIPMIFISLASLLYILTYKPDTPKYAGYLLGAIVKMDCCYYCFAFFIGEIKEGLDVATLLITGVLTIILFISIVTDFKLIKAKRKAKREYKLALKQKVEN